MSMGPRIARRIGSIIAVLASGLGGARGAPEEGGPPAITTASLVRAMTDLESLTRFPAPAFRTVQFSSYDRRSAAPYEPGWFANADGFGGEPIPGFAGVAKEPDARGIGTYVMADVKGPGAIVRTWTAAIGGTIKVHLDGAEQPIYDGEAHLFLDNPFVAVGGDEKALGANGFEQREAGYFPIPFATGCRILWIGKKDEVHFYQIQIRIYEEGTRVATFARGDLAAYAREIAAASAALANPGAGAGTTGAVERLSLALAAGEAKALFADKEGPRAITSFSARVQAPNPDKALRGTVLRMYFDGAPRPQVESPLGDFFGAGPGVNPYASLPMQVAPEGTMTARFVMPYAREARIELENWSGDPIRVEGAIARAPYAWEKGRSMHFFAAWRVDHDLWSRRGGEISDLPFLCARGKGVYVGTAAILMNPTPVPTPSGGWWGEGDEKVWIDDDPFPSTFGTGSEDYFNYAWSVPDLFAFAYFAQPQTTGPGNRGYVSNNRWHVVDALPFSKSIFFLMELCSHLPTRGLSYARLAYYYAFPNVCDDRVPISPEAARIPPLPAYLPLAAGGSARARFTQAEGLAAASKSGRIERREGAPWAGGKVLWWDAHDPEDALEIALPVEEKGTFRIGLTVANSPACDHVLVRLDGTPIEKDGRPASVASPHVTIVRSIEGDREFALEAGDHTLSIVAVTADGKPSTAAVGIDYIWLIKK